MTFNLVCAVILVLCVSTTTGVNWIGTFAANTTCNTTVCCCPKSGLTFTNSGAEIASTSDAVGMCKATSAKVKIDPTKNAAKVANYGDFTLAKDDNTIEVTLALNDGTLASACKIIMYRAGPGTGSTAIPAAGPGTGSTADPAAGPVTGPPAGPAAGPPAGPATNKPQSKPTPGSDATSNYGSIWLKFLLGIMATLFFRCI